MKRWHLVRISLSLIALSHLGVQLATAESSIVGFSIQQNEQNEPVIVQSSDGTDQYSVLVSCRSPDGTIATTKMLLPKNSLTEKYAFRVAAAGTPLHTELKQVLQPYCLQFISAPPQPVVAMATISNDLIATESTPVTDASSIEVEVTPSNPDCRNIPVEIWPFDPTEETRIPSYQDLGEQYFDAQSGPAYWSFSAPFKVAKVQVALPQHEMAYALKKDVVVETSCDSYNPYPTVNVGFNEPGFYGIKIIPVSSAIPPVFFRAAVNVAIAGPREDCEATKTKDPHMTALNVPANDIGIFVTDFEGIDRLRDLVRGDGDDVKIALKTGNYLGVTSGMDNAARMIKRAMDESQPNKQYSLSIFAHGLPSRVGEDTFVDYSKDVKYFISQLLNRVSSITFVSCCAGMNYPAPQWPGNGPHHLMKSIASGLTNFGDHKQTWARAALASFSYSAKGNGRDPYFFRCEGQSVEFSGFPGELFESKVVKKIGNDYFSWDYQAQTSETPANCVRISPKNEPHFWSDNMFCSSNTALELQFSDTGPVPGKTCERLYEDKDPDFGDNNFLCAKTGTVKFKWSQNRPADITNCLQVIEPSEPPHTLFVDNYLCIE